MNHHRRALLTGIAFVAALETAIAAGTAVLGGALPTPLPLFPSNNWWNLDISSAPVDPASASYITFINNGSTRKMHPDFGGSASPGSVDIYGFPYIVVDAAVPKQTVLFQYSDESDGVNHSTGASYPFYPIPPEAISEPHWIEGGAPGNVDQPFQHIGILSLEFHVDKLSRPLL